MRYFTISNTRRRGRALLAVAMATVALVALLGVLGSLPTAEARGPATANTGNSDFSLSSSDAITIFLPIVFKSEQVVVFFDEFNNDNSGWPHKYTYQDCYYEYSGGRYRVRVSGNGQRCIVPNGKIPKQVNGIFEVEVRRTSSEDMHYGFLFGAGTDATKYHWALQVSPDKDPNCNNEPYYWLVALVDGRNRPNHPWPPFAIRCTDEIKEGTSWNKLKVIRNGSSIQVFINGEPRGSYSNASYLLNEGYFDLQVISYSDETVYVEYDNLEIRRIQ